MTFETQSNVDSNIPPMQTRSIKIGPTKAAIVTKLLKRAKGATLTEIGSATGWQAHSCRAFLTAVRKKGVELRKEQRSDGRIAYRIVAAAPDVAVS